MINFNEQLSQEDAKWIIEEVMPKAGYRINHDTLAWWRDAHNKAFKEQVSIPGCSCEYVATMRVWQSRIGQHEQQIRDIAYPVIKTRINEENIIVEAVIEMQSLPNEIRVKTSTGTKGHSKKGRKPTNTAKSNSTGEHSSDPNDTW